MLAAYIAQKHEPHRSPDPPVADILLAYLRDKTSGSEVSERQIQHQ